MAPRQIVNRLLTIDPREPESGELGARLRQFMRDEGTLAHLLQQHLGPRNSVLEVECAAVHDDPARVAAARVRIVNRRLTGEGARKSKPRQLRQATQEFT